MTSVQEAKAAVVRQRVLDGVAELIAAGDDVTFAKAAAAAGVPERTVYRHFPSRDALMAGLYADTNARIGFAGDAASNRRRDDCDGAGGVPRLRHRRAGRRRAARITGGPPRPPRRARRASRRCPRRRDERSARPRRGRGALSSPPSCRCSARRRSGRRCATSGTSTERPPPLPSRPPSTTCSPPEGPDGPADRRQPHRCADHRPRPLRGLLHRRVRRRGRVQRDDPGVPPRHPAHRRDVVAAPGRARRQPARHGVTDDVRPWPPRPPRADRGHPRGVRDDPRPTRRAGRDGRRDRGPRRLPQRVVRRSRRHARRARASSSTSGCRASTPRSR